MRAETQAARRHNTHSIQRAGYTQRVAPTSRPPRQCALRRCAQIRAFCEFLGSWFLGGRPRLPTKPLTQRRRLAAAWAWERKLARLLAGMDKLLSRASALVGLGPACTPTITFSDEAQRKKINVIKEGQAESLLVFTDKDPVAGEVTLKLEPGKRLEHLGVKIEFIGMIEMFYGNYHEFSNLVRDLDAPGELVASKTYPFDFSSVDKQYDSYNGINVKLRYLLRVTVTRQYRYVCPSSSSGRAAGASVREAVRAGKPPRAHQTE